MKQLLLVRDAWLAVTALSLVLVIASADGANAQTAQPENSASDISDRTVQPLPITAYGEEARIDMITLSPSGNLLARVEALEDGRAIVVTNVADAKLILAAQIGDAKVRELNFIGEDRLLIGSSQTTDIPMLGVRKSEFYFGQILDLQTKKLSQVLTRTPGVLATPYGPIVVRYTASGPKVFARGYDVLNVQASLHRIDQNSGRGRSVHRMDLDVDDYLLDREGEVIAIVDYAERNGRWALRLRKDGRLSDNWVTQAPVDTPVLMGMGRSVGTILVSAVRPELLKLETEAEDGGEDGFRLFEVSLDTGHWEPLSYERYPRAVMFHPQTGLMIGVGYMDDWGLKYEFSDPLAARRWRGVERAFEGQYPQPVSWSHDMGTVLVYMDRKDAGTYQFVNFIAGRADIAGHAYPAITDDHLGQVQSLTYRAADGLEIHGYVTLPPGVDEARNLPLIVMPHGGPAARDVGGFDYWAQALASRGYVVLQPNFRGSTGYGRPFLEAGYGEWGRKMQTDLSDGVRHLVGQGMVDPARVCIVGGSYGGYAAMAGLALDGDVYRCAVAINGVSDLRQMLVEVIRDRGGRNNSSMRFWTRFMGASGAGDRGLDAYSPARLADQIKAPLLLIHGRDDTVVPIRQSRTMQEAMNRAGRPVDLVELDGEDHWLSRKETRQRMLDEMGRFLAIHNPVN